MRFHKFGINKFMTIKHKHHIIPRHMGGTDDPSNLVELTIQEHAEAHRLLFEKYGCWQDEVAWKALSGQIPNAEINRMISIIKNTGKNNHMFGKKKELHHNYGKKHTDETKIKIKNARAKQKINHSEETKQKISEGNKGRQLTDVQRRAVIESNKRRTGLKKNPYKNKGTKQQILRCPHCKKEGGTTMYRWHFDNCKNKVIND